ncbi:MAG TPA: diaminobutyrate--2-oxoglutarate transaminase [Syntrophomonadaceae bacterium]|nr:diaminobutyrate--2-oxoglutarate transaminase [Syntrophomonadaceae bacterium]
MSSNLQIFKELESEVRAYCRNFPTVFTSASGYLMNDNKNKSYIDFFSGAGALNYGHNHPDLKAKLLDYMANDGVTHSLDMATLAKGEFLQKFNEIILGPRNMVYKIMFPGPTGTNAVESALKLARKVTGRDSIMSFTNAFHGMTLGALSITGNASKRESAGVPLNNTIFMPFDGYFGDDFDTITYLKKYLKDNSSGTPIPAAIILETIQGEGGLNVASDGWLCGIEEICREWDIMLIVDDIQAGCGRSGTFFSFENAKISPDIICLSKSLSGYGLPMSINLIKTEHDIWSPGEHNGTFRGNNPAFVTATEALEFWKNEDFSQAIQMKASALRKSLDFIVKQHPEIKGEVKGRGFMQGIACDIDGLAAEICKVAFENGLVAETSGANNEVIKIMPPLIIDMKGLQTGLKILEKSIKSPQIQTMIKEKKSRRMKYSAGF